MRKPLALLVTLVLVVGLAACSSSSDSSAKTTTTASTKDTSQDPGHISTTTTAPFTPGTRSDYVTQLVKGLEDGDKDNGDLVLSDAQSACVAPVWIDTITVPVLTAKKVSPKALSSNDFDYTTLDLGTAKATTMVGAFTTCKIDVTALLAGALGAGQATAKQACIAKQLDDATTKELLIQALSTPTGSAGSDLQAKVQAIAAACKLSTN